MAWRRNRSKDSRYTAVVSYNLTLASIVAIEDEARRKGNNKSVALDEIVQMWTKWNRDTRQQYREWLDKMNKKATVPAFKGGEEE